MASDFEYSDFKPIKYVILSISMMGSFKIPSVIDDYLPLLIPGTTALGDPNLSGKKLMNASFQELFQPNVKCIVIRGNNHKEVHRIRIMKTLSQLRTQFDLKFIALDYIGETKVKTKEFREKMVYDIMQKENIVDEVTDVAEEIIRVSVVQFSEEYESLRAAKQLYFFDLVVPLRGINTCLDVLQLVLTKLYNNYPHLVNLLPNFELLQDITSADDMELDQYNKKYLKLLKFKKADVEANSSSNHSVPNDLTDQLMLNNDPNKFLRIKPTQADSKPKTKKYIIVPISTKYTGFNQVNSVLKLKLQGVAVVDSPKPSILKTQIDEVIHEESTKIIVCNTMNSMLLDRRHIFSAFRAHEFSYDLIFIACDYVPDFESKLETSRANRLNYFFKSINFEISLHIHKFKGRLSKNVPISHAKESSIFQSIKEFNPLGDLEVSSSNFNHIIKMSYESRRMYEYTKTILNELYSIDSELFPNGELMTDSQIKELVGEFDSDELYSWRHYGDKIIELSKERVTDLSTIVYKTANHD